MPMLIPRDRNWFVRDSSFIRFLFRRSKVRISFQIAFLVVFLECGRTLAQVEPGQAAPFVPDQTPTSLADLLREYRELGLPLPPKGTNLVSAGHWPFPIPSDGNVATRFVSVKRIEIRNVAAMKLATFWGMSCESEAFTPADWKNFRDKIRARVEKELKEK